MKKRTQRDWSKHELIITKNENVSVYSLKRPNEFSVNFINTNGILAVTGDYGNWIFCREFHPEEDSHVSDSYWIQKLKISSSQNPYIFDSAIAIEGIKNFEESFLKEHEMSQEVEMWINDLKKSVYDEIEFLYILYKQRPIEIYDCEIVLKYKHLNSWLLYIFDAFDEICERMN